MKKSISLCILTYIFIKIAFLHSVFSEPYDSSISVTGSYMSKLIEKANSGDSQSQLQLGIHFIQSNETNTNKEQAAYWLKKSAENGNVAAQTLLGVMYIKGEGIKKDYQKAFHLIKSASDKQDSNATLILAMLYEHGIGTMKNNELAILLYANTCQLRIVEGCQSFFRLRK